MSRTLAAGAAMLAALGAPAGLWPSVSIPRRKGSGGKYVGCAPSSREAARLAWRADVDRAARMYQVACAAYDAYACTMNGWGYKLQGLAEDESAALANLSDALAAPRPWRSARKPDPRRRYSRAHRRGCRKCLDVADSRTHFGVYIYCVDNGLTWQNPHGGRA